jgi:hypothetical protein
VNLSYAFDRVAWGLSSFGFHVTNGVIHMSVVALFYGWCTRALTDEANLTRHLGTARVEWPAFFAASAFGLHPLVGSTVLYVSARSEMLCALHSLAALILARRAIVESSRSAGLLALAFGALAVASGSSAAALPVLVLAYDAWVLRDSRWRRRMWRVYLPALAAIGIAIAWRISGLPATEVVPSRGPLQNLLGEAVVVWRYLGLFVFPNGQALVHEVRWPSTWDAAAIAALVVLVAGCAMAVRLRRAWPLVAFGVVSFFAVLAPSSSVIPLRDAMAESRMYFAAQGLLLAAASALALPLATRRALRAVATAVLLGLIVVTYSRNRLWADPLALWEEAVQRSPGAWQARLGHAEQLRELHRCDRAVGEYGEVLRLYPEQPQARAGLAACRQN